MEKMMRLLDEGFGSTKNQAHIDTAVESNFKEFSRKREFKRVMNR